MILEATEERMVVVSDLHLGSPASTASERLPSFFDHVEDTGAALCINGDGFELLQGSFQRWVSAALPVVRRLRHLRDAGCRIYYTIGNHDIAFEHVLHDLPIAVTPFLNVTSGDTRIHIEHGHLHEPFYARWPRVYEMGAVMARPLLVAKADTYALWSRMQLAVDKRRHRTEPGVEDDYTYYRSASMFFDRGFDVVIFGHTHRPEITRRSDGLFVNCGDWMTAGTFAEINRGVVTLERWG
jgi:UDP-2,3-diacylglucosamine pyrophosphatase LpxH